MHIQNSDGTIFKVIPKLSKTCLNVKLLHVDHVVAKVALQRRCEHGVC